MLQIVGCEVAGQEGRTWPIGRAQGFGRARVWALTRSFDGFNPVATAQQISERGFRRTSRVKVSGFLDRKALGLQSI
jgi:hypothetical protein